MRWGDGYKQGYRDAARKMIGCLRKPIMEDSPEFTAFMEDIYKTADGAPSMYAVANDCCGGVDAHDISCPRRS